MRDPSTVSHYFVAFPVAFIYMGNPRSRVEHKRCVLNSAKHGHVAHFGGIRRSCVIRPVLRNLMASFRYQILPRITRTRPTHASHTLENNNRQYCLGHVTHTVRALCLSDQTRLTFMHPRCAHTSRSQVHPMLRVVRQKLLPCGVSAPQHIARAG